MRMMENKCEEGKERWQNSLSCDVLLSLPKSVHQEHQPSLFAIPLHLFLCITVVAPLPLLHIREASSMPGVLQRPTSHGAIVSVNSALKVTAAGVLCVQSTQLPLENPPHILGFLLSSLCFCSLLCLCEPQVLHMHTHTHTSH